MRVLINTLPTDEKYPLLNRENLMIPIEMQLSQKNKKTFYQFSASFLKSRLNFESFEKKMNLVAFVFPKLRTLKTWLGKCLRSPVSEDISKSNMVNVPKLCWYLHHSTFIIFMGNWQRNCVRKSLSYSHAKSWDCLFPHWLPMKIILLLIETTKGYQLRCNYLRNKKIFLNFLLYFWNLY